MTPKLFLHAGAHSVLGRFSPKVGVELMRNRQVPFFLKVLALGGGVAATGALIAIEFPLELVIATVPGLGIVLDLFVDGAEVVVAPLLLGCMLLPLLARRASRNEPPVIAH